MPADARFLNDGYTLEATISGVPGVLPETKIVYRPALARERIAYSKKHATTNVDDIDQYEADLIARHCVSIDGAPVAGDRERIKKLHPVIHFPLIDLILSLAFPKERDSEKNSPTV
jgi:hypothetical protein